MSIPLAHQPPPAPPPTRVVPPVDRRSQILRLTSALAVLLAAIVLVVPLVDLRLARMGHHESVLAPLGLGGSTTRQGNANDTQLILVDSTPEGAQVLIDGELEGETPVSTDLHCTAGTDVAVEVKRAGYHTYKAKVRCAKGTIVKLEPELSRR